MIPGVYDIPQQYGNDTSEPMSFGFNIDLTDAVAELSFSYDREEVLLLTNNDGLTINGNTVEVAAFPVPNPPKLKGTYTYDLKLRFPDGRKKTYMIGNMPVLRDRS